MKKIFHVLLLVSILLLKVSSSAIHTYVAHDEIEDHHDKCELCEYALHNQDMETYIPVFTSTFALITDNFSERKNFYQSPDHKTSVTSQFFGRPPPSIA